MNPESSEATPNPIVENEISNGTEGITTAIPAVPNTQDQLIEVTIALLGIIALIYGVAWLIKRNRNLMPSTGIPMKTLGVLPMGVKEKVILVEIGGKQLLLGMTANSINTLAEFDEPVVTAPIDQETPFSKKLKELLNAGKPQAQPSEITQTDSKEDK